MSVDQELASIEMAYETINIEESGNLPVAIPVCEEEAEPYITDVIDFRQMYQRSLNLSIFYCILSCIVALVPLLVVVFLV